MTSNINPIPDLPGEVLDAAQSGMLIIFIGAGISRLAGCPSWDGFASSVINQLVPKPINYHQKTLINSLDAKKKLSIAKIISGKEEISINYEKIFEIKNPGAGIYQHINKLPCCFVTTNYDKLLKPEISATKPEEIWRVYNKKDILREKLDEQGNVIHLHGCIDDPDSMVITTKDYINHYINPEIHDFLEYLFNTKTVLFLGYGLEETEILEYILKSNNQVDNKEKRLFILQGFFQAEKYLLDMLQDYYRKSFNVELIGFPRDENDYAQQEEIIIKWTEKLSFKPLSIFDELAAMEKELMDDIRTPNGRSALNRALRHLELLPHLYKKVKDLDWFDEFTDKGLLSPENNPEPKQSKDKGYFQIPYWPILDYLVVSSEELKGSDNQEYARKYLDLIRDVTTYAIGNSYGNYRTWRRFAEILQNIPEKLVEIDDIKLVGYWLQDRFDRSIVGRVLSKWLLKLFNGNAHSKDIAKALILEMYNVQIRQEEYSFKKKKSFFYIDFYHIEEISNKVSHQAGLSLGKRATEIFREKLEEVLESLENDQWPYIWRPAIEDHDQNQQVDEACGILLICLRDASLGYLKASSENTDDYVNSLLDSKTNTVKRIAIYLAGRFFGKLQESTKRKIIAEKYFSPYFQHEIWHFLARNYSEFTSAQKEILLDVIDQVSFESDGGINEPASAYRKLIWLSAFKDKDGNVQKKYEEYTKVAKTEPENPDFATYLRSGWVDQESPASLEELKGLGYKELVIKLNEFKTPRNYGEPGIAGLTKKFRELVKVEAESIYKELPVFLDLDVPYLYELIEEFSDLWKKNPTILPWGKIWPLLLDYIYSILKQERFWKHPEKREDRAFVANHNWVVASISRFIKAACKSDEYAFELENIEPAKQILELILEKQRSESFQHDSYAASRAIHSPRGQCLEAYINLALFKCRNTHKIQSDHNKIWLEFVSIFDSELSKPNFYEFPTIMGNYLPNFLYLSKKWTTENLREIFNKENYQRWLCAIQGFSYVSGFCSDIYKYLSGSGDLIKVLEDENLEERTKDRYINLITIFYLRGKEDINAEDSMISFVLKRKSYKEYSQMIWFLWRQRDEIDKDEKDKELREKIYMLWSKIMENIDFDTDEGKKIASKLCTLSVFIDELDDTRKQWLMNIAPYAEVDHNSHDLLRSLARLSGKNPKETQQIWMKILTRYSYDYPAEPINMILGNLVATDQEGVRLAKEVVGKYLEYSLKRPSDYLDKILTQKSS